MRKLLAVLLVTGIVITGAWCYIYMSYTGVQHFIMERSVLGNWQGAQEDLLSYRSAKASYPIEKIAFLERFKLRLRYNEGVLKARSGNNEEAVAAFRDAALSAEPKIAGPALFNLAFYEILKSNFTEARSYLRKALLLIPGDYETKVNLEILLKKIKAKEKKTKKTGLDLQKRPGKQLQPGEQWRYDVPEHDRQGGPGSRRRYL
jgi:tetratricopeptide (TPR) repeat protein